jgi:Tol biopolymer transport system component
MPPTTPTPLTQASAGHRPSRHPRRLLMIAAVSVGMLFGSGSSAVAADGCANAALRAQNGSSALPECRAFEMVSPSYKQGFGIDRNNVQTFSDDGTIRFFSAASLAGNGLGAVFNQYLATRSEAGWVTSALNPPYSLYSAAVAQGAEAMSVNLDRSLWVMQKIDESTDAIDLYVRSADGIFTRLGKGAPSGTPYTKLVSADLSDIVFGHSNTGGPLSEYAGTGNTDRPVSVDNNGQEPPGRPEYICANRMSADGRVIVYTSDSCGSQGGPETRVWARVGGSATVEVSGSECTRGPGDPGGVCHGAARADFAGAAVDGSRVLFTTTQQLVNGDIDQSNDLYACDIPAGSPTPVGVANSCTTLTQISDTSSGAQVDNVAAVSDDGSHVYFVAHGSVLADNTGVNDTAAVADVHNLYLWIKDAAHPAGQITFIAPTDGSGQTTPDGRYYIFASTDKLVTSGPGDDGDIAVDIYRYDSVTKTMQRLSTSTSGAGGDDAFDAAFGNSGAIGRRATNVTADGSTVVFATDEALSPTDTNPTTDIYEWHDGQVSLISGAGGGNAPWITPSGRDIFFITNQPLTAADGDTIGDLYDARIGGGFDLTQPSPCSGEECGGPDSTPPSLTQPPPPPDANNAPVTTPKLTLKAISVTQRRTLAKTGKISLKITTNAPGTVTATATARLAGKATTIATTRRTVTGPATAILALTLSQRARTQLASHKKLTITITISHTQIALNKTTTLKLTHATATKKH